MTITDEICPLTESAISTLLAGRQAEAEDHTDDCRRRAVRWPFPGTVELWIPDEEYGQCYTLGTCVDLSTHGVGIRSDRDLPSGMQVDIALHEPENSFHGRAVVRHCSDTKRGFYLVGLQFLF